MTLHTHFHATKDERPDELNLRLHRALSWLKKAEESTGDKDIQFISLWIAFNAVYAKDFGVLGADRTSFIAFLADVCRLDNERQLYTLIWQTFSNSIRTLLDNRYTFAPFWEYHNGKISQQAWQESFARANKKAFTALAAQDTHAVLMVIFDRLYTLRNQLIHGGATYHSSVNRAQLGDACQILLAIIPTIINIIIKNPEHHWGKPFYPLVN